MVLTATRLHCTELYNAELCSAMDNNTRACSKSRKSDGSTAVSRRKVLRLRNFEEGSVISKNILA